MREYIVIFRKEKYKRTVHQHISIASGVARNYKHRHTYESYF